MCGKRETISWRSACPVLANNRLRRTVMDKVQRVIGSVAAEPKRQAALHATRVQVTSYEHPDGQSCVQHAGVLNHGQDLRSAETRRTETTRASTCCRFCSCTRSDTSVSCFWHPGATYRGIPAPFAYPAAFGDLLAAVSGNCCDSSSGKAERHEALDSSCGSSTSRARWICWWRSFSPQSTAHPRTGARATGSRRYGFRLCW